MSKSRKKFIRVTCIFLAVLMVLSLFLSVLPAMAVSRAEINKLKEEKEALEAKSEELQENIDSLESAQSRYIDRKAALDQRILCNQDEIEIIKAQIDLYDQQISETRQKLEDATRSEEEQHDALCSRMRAMEESGTLSYVDVLFSATSLTDLLSKASDISHIMTYDKNLQTEYVSARENVETLKAELEVAQTEQQAIRSELEFKQQQLEAQTTAAYEMLAGLENDLELYNKAYEENEQAEKELADEIDELMKELQRQEAAAAAAARPSGGGSSGGSSGGGNSGGSVMGSGSFVWPATSYLVTSEYGYRIHPLQGVQKFHSGVDIGAGAGTPIYAAAAGTVATATYNDSYGNYVLINHGGGNATLYAHMSSMAVSSGAYVTQGQVIGYVGSTGWSTGPHLHYEVRLNGSTFNPLSYYSGYTIYNG